MSDQTRNSDTVTAALVVIGEEILSGRTQDANISYIAAYLARTGLDPRPHLPVYFAYNFFRLAAIMQGIAGRVRDGTATSAYAASKAQLVRPLAAQAFEFAHEAKL